MAGRFLPGVPGPQVEEMYHNAPGNEIEEGKFDNPESSARLAANAFGFFINRPEGMPQLPDCEHEEWPATAVALEQTVRFPWRGGRHPVLDVLVTTPSALIGIESKRFEPFRRRQAFSKAYWRPEWGDRMTRYERIRDRLDDEEVKDKSLDAVQLVKHALALRTQISSGGTHEGLTPILFYVYAEPEVWPGNGKPVDEEAIAGHRTQIEAFADNVAGDEVRFVHCAYRRLLDGWREWGAPDIRTHAEAVLQCFSP